MSESYQYPSTLQESAFMPFPPAQSRDVIRRAWESPAKKLPLKRSVMACAFFFVYLAAYLGVGYAGIVAVEYAWSAIFG